MSDIKRVYSQPNASSLKEGEEVVYLGRGKPLARYRKEGGQVWVSYMTTNGDLFVEKDFNVQGTISQGGTGGGSGPPIVKGGLIEQTAGGLGVSSTGAISVSSGTVSAGTLSVAVGGTNATDSDTWLNTRVVMKANGVLGYDATAVACTMNTLADGGSIRSRVTAGLDSSGNVDRTVSTAKGGLGADFSGTATGFIRIINGTAAQRSYDDSKSDMSLDNVDNTSDSTKQAATLSAADADDVGLGNVANVDTRDLDNMNAGTLAIARGGTNAGNSNGWLNSRIEMNTNGTLDYAADGSGNPTMNTLTDANNIRARITGSLESANGLKTGIAIGDAVQTAVLYNGDAQEARTSPADEDYTITNSNVWEQDGTTQIIKISFDYLHNSNNRGLKLSCLLRSSSGSHNAVATLSVYNNTVSGSFTSGSLPDTSGSPIVSVALSTNKLFFDGTHTSSILGLTTASGSPGTGEVADGTLYKVTIGLHSADDTPSAVAYMSAPTVTVFGSTS
mgnify:CR=1 FL=1